MPVLHEDDALRALRAAVELRDAVDALGFRARIGVNTGQVVAGSGDALVTGDAVNVAARLEQAAEPREILVGEPTLQLARDAVEVESVEPVSAKGKPEPVAAYRLLRVVEGAPSFERRLDVPLVGRRDELARVRSAFDAALSERTPRLVTAFGPPGIGKTRLAREVAASLDGEADVLVGRCLPYGEGITYWPLAEIYRQAHAEDAWGTALAAGSPEDVSWEVRKWLESRARARPLTLVFEDIHWAEPPLLDLIEHVADWSRDAPMLLFCLARPDLRDERRTWGGEAITLEPLTVEESDELIESLLGEAELDDTTRSRIRGVAEGNPLFVEQLLAMIADGSAPGEVPATIQALLAARLDALPEEERAIVERAAVIGLDFEWEALGELAPDGRRPPGSTLSALVDKELIRPHEAIGDTFRFRHMLIRDAAYDRIPKAQRADLHERFAGWLDGRGEEFEEILGYHLEQAHSSLAALGQDEDRWNALGRRAAEHLASSGRRAYERGDLSAAADLLGRAAALLPAGDPDRTPFLPTLGRALADRGDWEPAKDFLAEAIETGEPTVAADATAANLFLWLHSDPQASHAAMRPPLEEAIRVSEEAGDLAGLANGLYLAGLMRFWAGDATVGMEELERAAGHARSAADRTLEAEIYASWLTMARHGPVPSSELESLAVEFRRRVPTRRLEVRVLSALAIVAALRDDLDTARRTYVEANTLAGELRFPSSASIAAEVELLAGNWPVAEQLLRADLERLQHIGDMGHYASLVLPFVDALVAQGRGEESRAAVELGASFAIHDDADAQMGVAGSRAALLLLEGDLAAAEAHGREAVAIAERTQYTIARIRALSGLADVLAADGRTDEAREALDSAIQLARQKESLAHERILRGKLAELQ